MSTRRESDAPIHTAKSDTLVSVSEQDLENCDLIEDRELLNRERRCPADKCVLLLYLNDSELFCFKTRDTTKLLAANKSVTGAPMRVVELCSESVELTLPPGVAK